MIYLDGRTDSAINNIYFGFYQTDNTFYRWVNACPDQYYNREFSSSAPPFSAKVELSKEGMYLNGEHMGECAQTEWQNNGYGMSLFGYRNLTTGNIINCARAQVYSCQIYKDNILIRDFIPCLDENDRPCMYDTVSEQPFYNQGSGEEFLYKLK